jgi:glycine cleavage system pyridoxal-binding protein P
MAFIPHTDQDVAEMLAAIGVSRIEQLFDEIPTALRVKSLAGIPLELNEMEIGRLMTERARADGRPLCFIGAGAYEHHIPAAVWAITTRGEFYSAYTPYQAEASQGTLQLLYEYQTMIASLTGMSVANASLYDGASAVAEASLMAVRANRKSKSRCILMPTTVHPHYRKVAAATAGNQGLRFEPLPFAPDKGRTLVESLAKYDGQDITALVIQQPNFFGVLEDVDTLTQWARARGALVIAVVNPTSLAMLKPPGEWGLGGSEKGASRGGTVGDSGLRGSDAAGLGGSEKGASRGGTVGDSGLRGSDAAGLGGSEKGASRGGTEGNAGLGGSEGTHAGPGGADIAVGEGQPLGVPLSSGGPYFGFMTTRMEYVRQMPGRIVGRTVDVTGREGFTLTLQAREQHIRRAKATSNICTNQGLLVTAATIYMSIMGPRGLERVAAAAHARTRELAAALTRVKGIRAAFDSPYFHEVVLVLDRPVAPVLANLATRGILGGLDLAEHYPELGHALLVCATETKTAIDIECYANALTEAMTAARAA